MWNFNAFRFCKHVQKPVQVQASIRIGFLLRAFQKLLISWYQNAVSITLAKVFKVFKVTYRVYLIKWPDLFSHFKVLHENIWVIYLQYNWWDLTIHVNVPVHLPSVSIQVLRFPTKTPAWRGGWILSEWSRNAEYSIDSVGSETTHWSHCKASSHPHVCDCGSYTWYMTGKICPEFTHTH